MTPVFAIHSPVSRGAFALVVLVSFAVLFAPASDVPPAPYGVDKLVHASLFAALAFTGRWAGVGRGVLATALVIYAAGSEVIQGLIGRDPEVGDWLADVVGVLVGLLVWEWAERRSSR